MNKKLIEQLLTVLVTDDSADEAAPALTTPAPTYCGLEGEYVIVRCRDAGVHAGTLVSLDGRTAILKDSRRLWYWKVANNKHSLSGVAKHGITSDSKIPAEVGTVVLPEACEVISTTDKCRKSIDGAEEYEAS